jgi:hypothetical protein
MHKDREVSVPPIWSEGTEPAIVYAQECFYRAYLYAEALFLRLSPEELKDVYLVHGQCILALGPHAWVELPGDTVFDGVLQRFYRLSLIQAAAWYKYTPSAATTLACNMSADAHGQQCYAFYLPLKLPWGDPANPLIIDDDNVIELLVKSGLRPDLANYKPRRRKRRKLQ